MDLIGRFYFKIFLQKKYWLAFAPAMFGIRNMGRRVFRFFCSLFRPRPMKVSDSWEFGEEEECMRQKASNGAELQKIEDYFENERKQITQLIRKLLEEDNGKQIFK